MSDSVLSSAVAQPDVVAGDRSPESPLHADICTLKPALDLQKDYFAVFGLQPACDIDLAQLAATYRSLQQLVHPDRFTRDCDRTQRLAQQQAAMVNAAYQTLKSPLARAQYLLELAGQVRTQESTLRDADFLMQQMLLRERLDEAAGSLEVLDALLVDVRASQQQYQQDFAAAWQRRDWPQARVLVDKLQFADKLAREIGDRQARLLDV